MSVTSDVLESGGAVVSLNGSCLQQKIAYWPCVIALYDITQVVGKKGALMESPMISEVFVCFFMFLILR